LEDCNDNSEADRFPFIYNSLRLSWNIVILILNNFVSEEYHLAECGAFRLMEVWRRFGGTTASILSME
jgi:hypothetical protein